MLKEHNLIKINILYLHFLNSILLMPIIGSCASAPDSPLFRDSGTKLDFPYESELPFLSYLELTREYVLKNRVFLASNAEGKALELDRVVPFEQKLPEHCSDLKEHAALLLHGVLDTAFAMRDIALALSQNCIASRAMLLPGHGTRPAQMVRVTHEQWVAAANYGLNSLKNDYEKVSIIGFSLGGLISLFTASNRRDVHRVIALSPALNVAYPALAWNTKWMRLFSDWIDIDPFVLPVRYSATSTNSIAEIYELSRLTQASLQQNGLEAPALMIQSRDEITIDPVANRDFFRQHMSDKHHLIEYGNGEAEAPRHTIRSSYFPEQKIFNFSHVTLPYSPENDVFGINGSHRECGLNIGIVDKELARVCMTNKENWKGEIGSAPEKYQPIQRLTFNPDFHRMSKDIVKWIKDKGT